MKHLDIRINFCLKYKMHFDYTENNSLSNIRNSIINCLFINFKNKILRNYFKNIN